MEDSYEKIDALAQQGAIKSSIDWRSTGKVSPVRDQL